MWQLRLFEVCSSLSQVPPSTTTLTDDLSRHGSRLEYVFSNPALSRDTSPNSGKPQLLASPTFHRMVRGVHKKMREMRHGPEMEDMGGTKIDSQLLWSTFPCIKRH